MAPSITSVTGTLTHGATWTIAGADFGTKATAAPKLWDNFESGTVGADVGGQLPVIGPAWGWYSLPGGYIPKYSSAQTRGVGTKTAYADMTTNRIDTLSIAYNAVQAQYFFAYWRYYSKGSTPYSRNVKPWCVYGSGTYEEDDQPLAYVGWGDPTKSDGSLRSGCIDQNTNTDDTLWCGAHSIGATEDVWVRHDVWLVQSSVGGYDGRFQFWSHRPGVEAVRLCLSDTAYRTRTTSNYWDQIELGYYSATDDPTAHRSYWWMDDVYIDDTPQRIEIGDASTWATCTWREIQRPTAWSDTGITLVANKGAHTDLSAAYLYVVDSTNTPSAGFALSGIDPPPTEYIWGIRSS